MDENKKELLEPVEEQNTTAQPESAPADHAVERVNAPDDKKEDEALNSFLSREQEVKKVKPSGKRKPLLILIVAVAVVAILAVLLIVLRINSKKTVTEETPAAEVSLSVNDGVHEANIALDDKGNILKNGSGSLLEYVPAQIKRIDVENKDGSFSVTAETPSGEATVYKVVGFEKYPLQEGVADDIAKHSSVIEFTRIIEANANLADFGLEEPRATAKVTYTDDTSSIIRVGNEAAGEAGTYVAFGTTKDVYLVNSSDVQSFLYSVNNFISLDITDKMEDSDNAAFSKATISGSHFDDEIVLVPNKDEAIEAAYLMTSPIEMPANAIEAGDIAGNIRGLYAESVVCVNPSDDQLASYGVDKPYAQINATYPDTDITLRCSAPKDDGIVYVFNPDKNVIYTIQLAAVCWAKTNVELLMPENPMNAKLRYIDEIAFSAGDTDFTLNVKTTVEETKDDSGNEQENVNSTASYDGKELNTDDFNVFFQNIAMIKNSGAAESDGKDKVMTVTFHYTTDRSADTLTVYSGDGSQYIMAYNGTTIGTVSKTYINSLIEGADNLIAGKSVAGL
nr:DUF4340 domain-containing protein [uncultured Ruminococcus sp.]